MSVPGPEFASDRIPVPSMADDSRRSEPPWNPREMPDRRRRGTRPLDVFFMPRRRGRFRRVEDERAHRIPMVDRHGWKFGSLLIAVLVLTLIDGVLTLLLVEGACEEANPLLALALEKGVLWFLGTKYILTAVGLACLLVLRYYRLFGSRFRVGHLIPIITGLYVVLLGYQAFLFWYTGSL